MERLNRNISASDCSLQQRPKVFHAVSVNLTINIFLSMVDYAVNVIGVEIVVRPESIAIDNRSGLYVRVNRAAQRFPFRVRNNYRSNFAVTFKQSHNGHLSFKACRAFKSAGLNAAVHVPRFAADERLIYFDAAAQLLCKRSSLHSEPDSVDHKPRGFLRDADGSVDFVRTNPVFAIGDHPNRHQPLIQTERGILEDGSDLDRKLSALMLALALPLLLLGKERNVCAATSRTDNAIGPSAGHKVINAVLRIREIYDCRLQCFRVCFVRHDVRIVSWTA